MNDLANQLLKAGLIDPSKHAEHEQKKRVQKRSKTGSQIKALTNKHRDTASFDRLETCTISEFRNVARKILEEQPDQINRIIGIAHRFKGLSGGDKLIWLMYQVRDRMKDITSEKELKEFLKGALRKRGSTLT